MSSTNRGTVRTPDDVYETPAWVVRRLLEAYNFEDDHRLCEPFVGSGKICLALTAHAPYDSQRTWDLCELRGGIRTPYPLPLRSTAYNQDFFTWDAPKDIDAIITNPPFSLADEAVKRCLTLAPVVAFLLRLNWWPHRPESIAEPLVFPLPNRPMFTEDLRFSVTACKKVIRERSQKGTSKLSQVLCNRELHHEGDCMSIGVDSCEYAWFLWGVEPDELRGKFAHGRRKLYDTPAVDRLKPRPPRPSKKKAKP